MKLLWPEWFFICFCMCPNCNITKTTLLWAFLNLRMSPIQTVYIVSRTCQCRSLGFHCFIKWLLLFPPRIQAEANFLGICLIHDWIIFFLVLLSWRVQSLCLFAFLFRPLPGSGPRPSLSSLHGPYPHLIEHRQTHPHPWLAGAPLATSSYVFPLPLQFQPLNWFGFHFILHFSVLVTGRAPHESTSPKTPFPSQSPSKATRTWNRSQKQMPVSSRSILPAESISKIWPKSFWEEGTGLVWLLTEQFLLNNHLSVLELERNQNASSLPVSEGEIIRTESLGRHEVRTPSQKKNMPQWDLMKERLLEKQAQGGSCCCCCGSAAAWGGKLPQVLLLVFKKIGNKSGNLALYGGNTYLHGSAGWRVTAEHCLCSELSLSSRTGVDSWGEKSACISWKTFSSPWQTNPLQTFQVMAFFYIDMHV